ncbi:MAG: peptidylprolyl isomerase [Pseudomonadota bacterium]
MEKATSDAFVDQLIDQELLAQELAAAGDIPAGVAVMLENEQRALYAREIIGSILSAEPDEAEVRAAYEAEIGALPTELEYSAAHILVETEEEASAILADLEAGADFAETAAEKSTGPSGPNGGDLGWFGAGAMVPAFDQAVQGMEPGALAGPVQTQFGWHVIKLNDTREKPKPTFEETRADFARQVRQGRLEAHIAGLRDSTAFEDLSSDVPATAIRDSASLP